MGLVKSCAPSQAEIRSGCKTGTPKNGRPSGRLYMVKTESETITKRNRKFFKLLKMTQDDADLDLQCAKIKVAYA
jgi:hypothetical protein